MFKIIAIPALALLAACSAETQEGEPEGARAIETLAVNNLIVTSPEAAPANVADEAPAAAPADSAKTAAPAPSQPPPQTSRKRSAEDAAEAAAAPKPAPSAKPAPEAETTDPACTAEHRDLGHC